MFKLTRKSTEQIQMEAKIVSMQRGQYIFPTYYNFFLQDWRLTEMKTGYLGKTQQKKSVQVTQLKEDPEEISKMKLKR